MPPLLFLGETNKFYLQILILTTVMLPTAAWGHFEGPRPQDGTTDISFEHLFAMHVLISTSFA